MGIYKQIREQVRELWEQGYTPNLVRLHPLDVLALEEETVPQWERKDVRIERITLFTGEIRVVADPYQPQGMVRVAPLRRLEVERDD